MALYARTCAPCSEYTEAKFRRDSITIRTGANVVSVKPGLVTLSDGTSLPFGLGVWNTGYVCADVVWFGCQAGQHTPSFLQPSSSYACSIGPRPLIASLSRDKFWCDRWGHLRTTGALNCLQPPPSQASGASVQSGVGAGAPTPAPAAGSGAALAAPIIPGMFALGDCASVEGEHFAATAQVAEQQGAWLAQHLNKAASTAASAAAAASVPYSAAALQAELTRAATQDSTRFEYNHRGSLAFIGTFSAVNDFTKVKPKTPLYGAKIRGALAWFVWRSAYLTKLGSWRNRMQVPLDWSRTLLFGRDTTQF
ncbi:hypothetical protein EON62_02745 [archaeon]|nr:MAG: hypothetical protein EON62_02745 [archaeon]